MATDDDLVEYTGADKTTPAVPKSKPKSWTVTDTPDPAYGAEVDEPAPRVAVYNPPAPGASHPHHAVLGPALRLDKAEHVLTKANAELTHAARALRDAELAEADAEAAFMLEFPGQTQDEALRAYGQSELKARAERVAAGLSPDARNTPVHGSSVLDRNAAHRPRPVPGRVAAPLQSNAVRR
jgi:hypothetical protein